MYHTNIRILLPFLTSGFPLPLSSSLASCMEMALMSLENRSSRVEQFHLLDLNWNWHSSMAWAAPRRTESMKAGLRLQKFTWNRGEAIINSVPNELNLARGWVAQDVGTRGIHGMLFVLRN